MAEKTKTIVNGRHIHEIGLDEDQKQIVTTKPAEGHSYADGINYNSNELMALLEALRTHSEENAIDGEHSDYEMDAERRLAG